MLTLPMGLLSQLLLITCLAVHSWNSRAYAWGERGHDLITRAATRLLLQHVSSAPVAKGRTDKSVVVSYAKTLRNKEHMLAHLANVPDILWRNMDQNITAQNAPTHFIDLEYAALNPSYEALPRTTQALERALQKLCQAPPENYLCPDYKGPKPQASDAGTAPWRVAQLFALMKGELQKAADTTRKANATTAQDYTASIDKALIYAGLMSHFVGDLANPFHTSRDYDGWEHGAGGIHAYFETELVDTYDFDLDLKVTKTAASLQPRPAVLTSVPPATREAAAREPLSLALALAINSHKHLPAVRAADKKHAVLKPSRRDKGMSIKAERRPPEVTAPAFEEMIVEHLAVGAQLLAHLWILAWEEGGRPDFSRYQSYAYTVAPEFIGTSSL